MPCFKCLKKKSKKRLGKLGSLGNLGNLGNLFERGSLKLSCLIDKQGKVLETLSREDLGVDEIGKILAKVVETRNSVQRLNGGVDRPVHIQGGQSGISIYPVPLGTLALLFDINPSLVGIINLEALEERMFSFINTTFN